MTSFTAAWVLPIDRRPIRNGIVDVWSTADGSLVSELAGHVGPVNGVAFLPSGGTLVTAGTRRVAVIVEPGHPARIQPLLMAAYGLTARE